MITARIINGVCRALYRSEYRRFASAKDIGRIQRDYLSGLLRKNADTVYGRKYGFSDIDSYERFAANVPITTYEDYEPYIDDIANGANGVLTAEPVLLFEPTSGSTGGKKLIPYTSSLRTEFQRGIKPWMYDIYTNIPGVRTGKSYWSITPVTGGKTYTKAGIPIGFEEDSAYFGKIEKRLMDRVFAVRGDIKFSESTETFYLETARRLLKCRELTLISVWNPTFLTILCENIKTGFDSLKNDLSVKRADEIYSALSDNRFDRVFPSLRIISCWADGNAAEEAKALSKLFPTVFIQPKGLLATEYFASFPLVGEPDGRLCATSHFFEFRNAGGIVTADKLLPGEYELIVTTGGGFYRYMTGDVVEVTSVFPDAPPRLRFLRRSGAASDLCGEKLTDSFVHSACKKLGIADKFCLLAPEGKGYVMYTASEHIDEDTLDTGLRESYHYNYCRDLGQLGKVKIVRVADNSYNAYLRRLTDEGMRLGDIKTVYLSSKSGWDKYFDRK